ncbi:MAG: MliC family protein [Patescibacteria group bacterium]|nr:MliC family protein [Patescibacteria group bacterium]
MSASRIIGLLIILIVIAGGLFLWETHSGAPSSTAAVPISSVSYLCDGGKTIAAKYYNGPTPPSPAPGQPPTPTGSVTVALSDGRSFTLPQTLSASGIRYANSDESFIFWSEGNGAFVEENNVQTYSGCVAVAPDPGGLPNAFASSTSGFSIRYLSGYTVDTSYQYQELGPTEIINGIKFTIPPSVAQGTNLGSDSYLSVEQLPTGKTCDASLFLYPPVTLETLTQNNTTYSVASSTGAGAGNRYEEWVYAIPGSSPCTAVRYFIHYAVLENYPPGTVQAFNEQALLTQFDAIRSTLTLL